MTETQNITDIPKKTDNEPLRVCFVCTGNTCRSPMAMAVLNHLGKGNYIATSAGLMADKGSPINEKARNALINANIISSPENDYDNHKACQLDMGIMQSCDLIVAVGKGHAMMIIQNFPIFASKVTSFDRNITDPYGQSQQVYDDCLCEITDCIKRMFALGENNE